MPAKQHQPAFVLVHQMSPSRTVVTTSSRSLLLIYRPRKDERLSWPSWLTYSRWFTHISGHPSAAGRAQDSKNLPVKNVLPLSHGNGRRPNLAGSISLFSQFSYNQQPICTILGEMTDADEIMHAQFWDGYDGHPDPD